VYHRKYTLVHLLNGFETYIFYNKFKIEKYIIIKRKRHYKNAIENKTNKFV